MTVKCFQRSLCWLALLSGPAALLAATTQEEVVDERSNVCLGLIEAHCNGDTSADIMDACISTGLLSCARPEFCAQPKYTGMCRAAFPRFYFDIETGDCGEFLYGGCDAKENNFLTQQACEDACAGLRYCGGNTEMGCPEDFECFDNLCTPEMTSRNNGKPVKEKKKVKEDP
jgi:hypothetical protein